MIDTTHNYRLLLYAILGLLPEQTRERHRRRRIKTRSRTVGIARPATVRTVSESRSPTSPRP